MGVPQGAMHRPTINTLIVALRPLKQIEDISKGAASVHLYTAPYKYTDEDTNSCVGVVAV